MKENSLTRTDYKVFSFGFIMIFLILTFGFMSGMIACTQNGFEIKTTIEPKLNAGIKGRVAVEFKLGELLILDEWKNLNTAQVLFLTRKDNPLKVNLRIVGDDMAADKVVFIYTVANMKQKTAPIVWSLMMEHIDSISNVKWSIKEGKTLINQAEQTNKSPEVKPDPIKKKI